MPPQSLSPELSTCTFCMQKLPYIHNLFIAQNLSFVGLMETWLTSSGTASLAAHSYADLQFTHTPCPSNKHVGGLLLNPIPPLLSFAPPFF